MKSTDPTNVHVASYHSLQSLRQIILVVANKEQVPIKLKS